MGIVKVERRMRCLQMNRRERRKEGQLQTPVCRSMKYFVVGSRAIQSVDPEVLAISSRTWRGVETV